MCSQKSGVVDRLTVVFYSTQTRTEPRISTLVCKESARGNRGDQNPSCFSSCANKGRKLRHMQVPKPASNIIVQIGLSFASWRHLLHTPEHKITSRLSIQYLNKILFLRPCAKTINISSSLAPSNSPSTSSKCFLTHTTSSTQQG